MKMRTRLAVVGAAVTGLVVLLAPFAAAMTHN